MLVVLALPCITCSRVGESSKARSIPIEDVYIYILKLKRMFTYTVYIKTKEDVYINSIC